MSGSFNIKIFFAVPEFPSFPTRVAHLNTLFPDGNSKLLNAAALDSTTTDQAVEKYLKSVSSSSHNMPSTSTTSGTTFQSFQSLLDAYQEKVSTSAAPLTLTLKREELWRSALAFYKKAINSPQDLFKSFEVS